MAPPPTRGHDGRPTGSAPSYPDAASLVAQAQRHVALEPRSVEALQVGIESDDLELAIEGQEGSEKVGLRPCPPLAHPFLRVLEGIEDVMEVDVDPTAQAGQALVEQVLHIAADLHHVGGVHHEDVTSLQVQELGEGHVLKTGP